MRREVNSKIRTTLGGIPECRVLEAKSHLKIESINPVSIWMKSWHFRLGKLPGIYRRGSQMENDKVFLAM